MLQELTHMDRITQLQDEIQNLLMIMANSINYLTTRADFTQVSPQVPITKQRNPDKVDAPDVFEANKKELARDLALKARQVDYLIQSLPPPEPEEKQAERLQSLEKQMTEANEEYVRAVRRARALHKQLRDMLDIMLTEHNMLQYVSK
ncbi:hypothetical protein BJ322DRAFT_60954 [Thelephora terrestris]|uniref:Mediator of RNA polymerase II transcription subunit 21 n=1 Tax=Thelephora terrestris TaxID=56493 RepID=A0A9P6HQF6_9AGAM|nr:hypothetical protein BJ322DRAFT_60954 [Thelephora terrestris]